MVVKARKTLRVAFRGSILLYLLTLAGGYTYPKLDRAVARLSPDGPGQDLGPRFDPISMHSYSRTVSNTERQLRQEPNITL